MNKYLVVAWETSGVEPLPIGHAKFFLASSMNLAESWLESKLEEGRYEGFVISLPVRSSVDKLEKDFKESFGLL